MTLIGTPELTAIQSQATLVMPGPQSLAYT